PAHCALVVDEGPGISGSSMAAVAEALVRSGVHDIAFLPGHGGDPGWAASPEIRRRWRETPRYVTPLDSLTWNGRSLKQQFVMETEKLAPGGPFEAVDLS